MATARPAWMEKPKPAVTLLKGVVIGLIVLVMLYPFWYVIVASLSTAQGLRQHTGFLLAPAEFTLDAYRAVLSGDIVTQSLLVSVFVTVVGTLLAVVLTVLTAYGLTRTRDVPGSRALLYLILFTMLFTAGIIPNYLLIKGVGLLDSLGALILPGAISAFNLVVVRNFFMELPGELLDSARVDGAGEWRILSQIVVPLSKSIIAVIALFYGVSYWNEFFNALLYLQTPQKWPVQLVLNQYVVQASPLEQISFGSRMDSQTAPRTIQMAIVIVATLPILVVYPFLQKYFTKGVLTGAIKG
ncbi:carbohydrate ABC transporter permease [Pseudactinotalea terrae]|uniref:carbohydrate ABC transporter permease n=1 Tax=Pseudactinotalea terrae TaxID=1743262 RepID=UPI0012E10A77|nr:carbohydrate ABC transporter permease [Pseudactinotalea terrae]